MSTAKVRVRTLRHATQQDSDASWSSFVEVYHPFLQLEAARAMIRVSGTRPAPAIGNGGRGDGDTRGDITKAEEVVV